MSEERHRKPKLIVFDLDYTLWPFFVQKHLVHPLTKYNGEIVDMCNKPVKPYPEVPTILSDLHEKGYELAIASRTNGIKGANHLLHLLEWDKYFKYKEIYPMCKLQHFSKFCDASDYKYEEMLFFDDDPNNIQVVSEKGVTCVQVPWDGLTKKLVEQGLDQFALTGYNWYEDY